MHTMQDRTAWDADFETVIVDLNGPLNFQVHVSPERRSDISNGNKDEDADLALYERRMENDESAVDSMLRFFVHGACGSTESCQPLESILKTSSARTRSNEARKLQGVSNIRRSVEFKRVVIREFGLTLGDHPNSISGPPVRLDWDHEEGETHMDLEEYEETRKPRRSRRQMKLSMSDRHRALREHTYSEIKLAWKAALQIREQRIETSSQTLLQRKLDECWESLGRKYGRFLERTTLLCI